MSTTSHWGPSVHEIPSYTQYKHENPEKRSAIADGILPSDADVRFSKSGNISLRLSVQENSTLSGNKTNGIVHGIVEVTKTEGIARIDITMEGSLKIREIGEGGHATVKLCFDQKALWVKEGNSNPECPSLLNFSLRLPDAFTYEEKTYLCPPTYGVKLSGIPGFTANIEYSISVHVDTVALSSRAFRLFSGTTAISTPFVYHPRTRPQAPIPPPLATGDLGFIVTPEWTVFESVIPCKQPGLQDIATKLYIPSSQSFCLSESIPFHLSLHSTSSSLIAFLPMGPTAESWSGKKPMQVQIMRQSTVDVRNLEKEGVRQDMWRVDCIGNEELHLTAQTATWIAYSGEIRVKPKVKVPSFKVAGLSVKDFILFTVTPSNPAKSPFGDLRQVASIMLTTESWTAPQETCDLPNGLNFQVKTSNDSTASMASAASTCVGSSVEIGGRLIDDSEDDDTLVENVSIHSSSSEEGV